MEDKNLETMLRNFGIPYEEWGKGNAKTLTHLRKEIGERETVLQEKEGKLVRNVSVSYVNVFYNDENGNTYKLIEDRQEFRDGRVRKRPDLMGSLAEKMKVGEDPQETAYRALSEELGIRDYKTLEKMGIKKKYTLHKKLTQEEIVDSPSYPGLLSKFTNHLFEVILPEYFVKPEGYIEKQWDKNTFWRWEVVDNNTQKSERRCMKNGNKNGTKK